MAEKSITWYNRLKEAINGQIKENGKREITGVKLNSVLNQMVDALGKNMTFGGVVSPATVIDNTDDNPVFYLALEAGNYPYCGNIVVGQGQIAFLFRDANNIWHQASWNAPDENFTTEEKEKLQGLPTEEQLREAFGAKANAPESKPGRDNLASFDEDGNLKDSGVSIPVPTEEEKEHVLSSGETGLEWVPKPVDGADAYGVYVKQYDEQNPEDTEHQGQDFMSRDQWLEYIRGKSAREIYNQEKGTDYDDARFIEAIKANYPMKYVAHNVAAYGETSPFDSIGSLDAGETTEGKLWFMPNDDNTETKLFITVNTGTAEIPNYKWYNMGIVDVPSNTLTREMVDNECTNGAVNTPASAKVVMDLKAKLHGNLVEEKKIQLVEHENYESGFYVNYDTENGHCISEATTESQNDIPNAVCVINVEGYNKIRFLGCYLTTTDTAIVGYGFCEEEPTIEIDYPIDVCTPFTSGAFANAKKEYIIDIPEDKKYFVCTIRCYNNVIMSINDYYCYLQRGLTVNDIHNDNFIPDESSKVEPVLTKNSNYIRLYSTTFWFSGDFKVVVYPVNKSDNFYFLNKTTPNSLISRAVYTSTKDLTFTTSGNRKKISGAIGFQEIKHGDKLDIPDGAMYVCISDKKDDELVLCKGKNRIDAIEEDVSTIKGDITEIDDRFKSVDFESLTQYIEVNNHGVTVPSSNTSNINQSTPDYIKKPKAVKKYRLYPVSEGDVVKVSYDFKTNTNGAGIYNIILLSAETDVTNQTFNGVSFDEEDAFKFAFADYDENGNYLNPKQGLNFVLKEKVTTTGTNKKTVSFTIPDGYHTLCFNIYNEGTSDVQKEVIKTHNFENIYTEINEIKTKIDAQTLPEYYSNNNYLNERCRNVIDRIAGDFNLAEKNADNGIVGCYKDGYLFVTDLHYPYNYGMSGKVMAEVIKKTPIKKTINGGDICGNNSQSFETGLDPSEGIRRIIALSEADMNHVIDAGSEYYQVRGNHDFSLSKLGVTGTIETNPNKYLPIKEVYSYLMSKNTKNNVVSGVNTGDSCCFYKDYIGNKLRYIFLDSNDNNDAVHANNTMRQCFTNAQFRWLADVILNTPNDYNIVVISHHYCLLQGFGDSYNSNDYKEQNKVARLIKAVNERSTYGGEYDFTNFNPKVLLHHCGHHHRDKIFYCGYWEVIQASGHTNSDHEGFEQYYFGVDETENIIVGGSVKEILFDAVVIDNGIDNNVTNDCEINFIRFGPGCDRVIHQNEIILTEGDSPIDLSSKLVRLKDADDVQYICWDSDNKSYDIGGPTLKYRNIHAHIENDHNLVFGKSETEDIGNIKPNNYSNIDYTPNLANSGYVTVYAFSKELNIMEIFGVKVIAGD